MMSWEKIVFRLYFVFVASLCFFVFIRLVLVPVGSEYGMSIFEKVLSLLLVPVSGICLYFPAWAIKRYAG